MLRGQITTYPSPPPPLPKHSIISRAAYILLSQILTNARRIITVVTSRQHALIPLVFLLVLVTQGTLVMENYHALVRRLFFVILLYPYQIPVAHFHHTGLDERATQQNQCGATLVEIYKRSSRTAFFYCLRFSLSILF